MSEVAMIWVDHLTGLDVTAKAVLDKLARFADDDDCAWARVDDLALRIGCSVRTVQYRLRELEGTGHIRQTGRVHRLGTRKIPIYEIMVDHGAVADHLAARKHRRRAEAEVRGRALTGCAQPVDNRPAQPSMGADLAPMDGGMGADVCTPMGATVCTHNEPILSRASGTDVPEARARGRETLDEAFEAALTAYPNIHDTDVPAARTAFAAAAREAGDPWRLVQAAKGYADHVRAQRARGGANFVPALQTWLGRKSWLVTLRTPDPAEARREAEAAAAVASPWPELRAAVATARGETFAAAYLDLARLGEGGVIVPATGTARERLAREAGRLIAAAGLTLGEPEKRRA